jgi:hypothetical protein
MGRLRPPLPSVLARPKIPPANLDEAFLPTSYALYARHKK